MKQIILIISLCTLLFSCSSHINSVDIKKAELAHSKFTNINKNFSYEEYKSLIVEYGENSNFPDLK